MTETTVSDLAGNAMDVLEVRGRIYPRFPLDALENTFNFKARPEDIVLCTYPKSGTHWAFEIIRLLLAENADLPMAEKDDTMMEEAPPASLDALPSPRNINTHFHFDSLSPEFFRHKCKIIYVVRNPRDVFVSYFHHHNKLKQYYNYKGEWKDYFSLILDGKLDYGSWFEYTKGWEKGMREHPNHPFLALSFEEMKEHPLREVKKIAEFLGKDLSEEFLQTVVQKTSFETMRRQREPAENKETLVMYRKGKVGDWKNLFTVAQSEIFDQKFEEEMAGTDAYQLYSHSVQKNTDLNSNSA